MVANGGTQNIADLFNKGSSTTEGLANVEKLKGQFRLRINHNLDMKTKIGKYGQDPVAFHLHK